MKYLARFILFSVFWVAVHPVLVAAPWEVLSSISYVQHDGENAVRIDFALPVHYVRHFPRGHGRFVKIDIDFNQPAQNRPKNDAPGFLGKDISQSSNGFIDITELPLLQTLQAPDSLFIPLKQVTYIREGDEPKLLVEFTQEVDFSVEQAASITSMIIKLSGKSGTIVTEKPVPAKAVAVIPVEKEIKLPEATTKAPEDIKVKKIFDTGRTELKRGNNKKAIQIFTKLLSMSKHKYLQSSLEFLGLARDRNNQAAHAKSIYKQYLKKYPKGDGATRVRQRLAELISSFSKPKKRLKKTETADLDRKTGNYKIYGNFSQYLDYTASETSVQPRETDAIKLSNQLSLNVRARYNGFDIRNYLYANYDYEVVDDETDGLEMKYLYSKIRNASMGVNAVVGRQRASLAGTSSIFDGFLLGYQLSDTMHVNAVYGYQVDSQDRGQFQSDKPFFGGSLEFNNVHKGLDVGTYWYRHLLGDYIDREVIGAEVRYLDDKFSFTGEVDYDIYFEEVNSISSNGRYILDKNMTLTVLARHQKSPFLETGNALIGFNEDVTLDDLKAPPFNNDDDGIKTLALNKTGSSTELLLGLSHKYTKQITVSGEISWSQYVPSTDAGGGTDSQLVYTARMISLAGFHPRDMSIVSFGWIEASGYTQYYYSGVYRRPIGKDWRASYRLAMQQRKVDSGQTLTKTIPGLKLDKSVGRNLQLYLEASVELWDYSEQEDLRSFQVFGGYSWSF